MRLAAQKLIVVILFLSVLNFAGLAQQRINVVTTAVPFLRISPDARAGGMGDIGVATSPDANSGFWNIGKVAFNKLQAGVSATYTPWLKDVVSDVFLASVAGYYRIDENQAIHGGLRYFSLGNIQFTDQNGTNLNTAKPREFDIEAGYSRKLSSKIGIGITLRYINSDLASGSISGSSTYKAGSAVAGDIGFYADNKSEAGNGWTYGATLTNLGGKIGYTDNADEKDFIPANLGLGTTYSRKFDEQNKITFGLDINKLLVPTPPAVLNDSSARAYRNKGVVGSWFSSFGDAPDGFGEELKEFQVSLGAEYWYNDQFAFRAGYFYEDKTKGNRKYFSLGLGLKYNLFGFNFAYLLPSGSGITRNPLSNTLRFSLMFDFDGSTKAKE